VLAPRSPSPESYAGDDLISEDLEGALVLE